MRLQALGKRPLSQPKWLGGQLTWELDLEPFDVIAAVLSSDQVRSTRGECRSIARPTLSCGSKSMNWMPEPPMLGRPEPIDVLTNPSFEAAPDRLPGWIHAHGDGIVIGPDNTQRFDGGQSLKMTSQGPVAWIRSDPFDPPKTGRIAVIVRLMTDDPNKQPPLRLAIDGKYLDGATYYMPFNVGQGAKVQPLANDWGAKAFVLLISDLPVHELANIRVGFDLMGAR